MVLAKWIKEKDMNNLLLIALYRPYQELVDFINSGRDGYYGTIQESDLIMFKTNDVPDWKLDKLRTDVEVYDPDKDEIYDDENDCLYGTCDDDYYDYDYYYLYEGEN